MEVFVDVWEAQVDELGKVLRLITAGGDPSKSKFYVVFYTIICLCCAHPQCSGFSMGPLMYAIECTAKPLKATACV